MSIVNSNNFLHKTVDGVKQFFSPLVNAATVVLKDGTRLEKDGKIHADTADDSKKMNGKAPSYYTPYTNIADNSDFEHWVAQAGIAGKHGNETYGGDRWILTGGSITGTANADGDGYSDITLNGTLVQVVSSPPSVATPFVEMVSGTAEISYDASKGEITITSAGGVIKNVLLLEGEWNEKPPYVAKGYATELAECRLYYQRILPYTSFVATYMYNAYARGILNFDSMCIGNPTVGLTSVCDYIPPTGTGTWTEFTPVFSIAGHSVTVINSSAASSSVGTSCIMRIGLELSADL